MSKFDFIDSIRFFCRSGNGGKGSTHFLRSKFNSKGGPDGGDGGRGGHIILQGNENLWTLYHLKYKKHILAAHGEYGNANKCYGKAGNDIIIQVPLGSVALDEETGKQEAEITYHNQQIIWMRGGKGGRGNVHFANAIRQAPSYAQKGEKGIEAWKRIELKLLADVGLVGLPNAGKSTLLSALSAAKPKIASYPFTTLVPNLGIVASEIHKSFCIADIPGIIKNAHKGKGLGLRFLRHIERNSLLAFVIPITSEDVYQELLLLQKELYTYNRELEHKSTFVIITKIDLASASEIEEKCHILTQQPIRYLCVSALTSNNTEKLKHKLWKTLQEA